MRLNPKMLFPAALIALGVWLLVGCVYIPTFGTTVAGRNVAGAVGAAGSSKPLRLAQTTLADVVRILGEPPQATADRRVVAYPWTVRHGYFVWPLCFAGASVYGRRTLVLRFDERQVLQSFEVLKRDENLFTMDGGASVPLVPREIERDRAAASRRFEERRRAATRPVTTPATAPVTQPR